MESQQQITMLSATQPVLHKGDIRDVRYGYELQPDESRIKYIKLFLDRTQDYSKMAQVHNTPEELFKYGRYIEDAVTDFLAKIYERTRTALIQRYRRSVVMTAPIQYVLTVPAVWSDYAKEATLRAAQRAGMGHDIGMVSEPEAAAIHTFHVMRACSLKAGENFVICDAGGGTVDLISYRITQSDPLCVEETATGTGGLCGSSFLDIAFEEYIRERMGLTAYTAMKQRDARVWQTALRYFEDFIKRRFSGSEDTNYNIPLPGLPNDATTGIEDGYLVLTPREVQKIFDPIVDQVIALVQGQVHGIRAGAETVDGIILVGGFGQSSYLYSRLSEHFSVDILRPSDAWSAVARGAALYGLRGDFVVERRARYHYGVTYDADYDDEVHSAELKTLDKDDNKWRVKNCMQWFVRKNEPISAKRTVSFPMQRDFSRGTPLREDYELWACSDEEAPMYKKSDDGLFKVCQLTIDLSQVPEHEFFIKYRTKCQGGPFRRLLYDLVMRIDSAKLSFDLEIDEESYGRVEASFDE